MAGGKKKCSYGDTLCGENAPVEVLNTRERERTLSLFGRRGKNKPTPTTWSVVEQKHIPPNNLNAVEIEGRVYFIINKFLIDSGIRIQPKDTHQVNLDGWENITTVSDQAVLCYLPVKKEDLK